MYLQTQWLVLIATLILAVQLVQGQLNVVTRIAIGTGSLESKDTAEVFLGVKVELEWLLQKEVINSVTLKKDGTLLIPEIPDANNKEVFFTITSAQLSDTGNYTLDIVGESTATSSTISLTVKAHPKPAVTAMFSNVTLIHGSSMSFKCNSTGEVSKFRWNLNGDTIFSTEYELINREETMKIKSMKRELAGTYQCFAEGADRQRVPSNKFQVNFEGLPPGAPEKMTATPVKGSETTSVKISWKAPSDLGFNLPAEIVYVVRYCIVPETNCSTNQTSFITSKLLERLSPSTTYSIKVLTQATQAPQGGDASLEFTTALCLSNQYQCPNETKCISNGTVTALCDGKFDCLDKSDETIHCDRPNALNISVSDIKSNGISVSWVESLIPDNSDRIEQYQVFLDGVLIAELAANHLGYDLKNLTSNTNYTITVRARNPSGYSDNSTIHTTTKFDLPSAVELLVPVTRFTEITVTWISSLLSEGINLYQVFLDGVLMGELTPDMTEHTFKNLTLNTNYTISVRAKNPAGYSINSHILAKTKIGHVGVPLKVESVSEGMAQRITWEHPTVTGGVEDKQLLYSLVYYKFAEMDQKSSVEIPMGDTSYTIMLNTSNANELWTFVLKVSNMGPSNQSVERNFTFIPTAPPSALQLEITPYKTSIFLSWNAPNAVEMVSGYILEVNSTAGNGTIIPLAIFKNATNHTIMGLEPDTTYSVDIYGVNADGNGKSVLQTVLTRNCEDNQFQCLNKECIASTATCNEVADCKDGSDEIKALPANCSLPADLSFRIMALYDKINITFDADPKRPPSVVVIVAINDNIGGNISLPDGFQVVGIKHVYNFTDKNQDSLVIEDPRFVPGVNSTVFVYGSNLVGFGTIQKEQIRTLGPSPDGPPVLVSTTIDSITIKVNAKRGVTNASINWYFINFEKGNKQPKGNRVPVNDTITLEHVIKGLEYNITYEVKYRVVDSDGESEYSPTVKFTTKSLVPPSSPITITSQSRRNSIEVTWIPSMDDLVTEYTIQYKTSSMSEWKESRNVLVNASLTHTIDGLQPNQSVDIRVAAINPAGVGSFSSQSFKTDPNVCPGSDWEYFVGNCYYVDDNNKQGIDATQATMKCQQMNSTLASIENQNENLFIMQEYTRLAMPFSKTAFIGLKQLAEMNYTWLDESTFAYNNLETTAFDANKACVVLDTVNNQPNASNWLHVQCSSLNGYICKRENTPLHLILKSTGYDSLTFILPRTTFKSSPKWMVNVGDSTTFTSESTEEVTVNGLQENTEYLITVQEDLNGLGQKSANQMYKTRNFTSPSKVTNITDSSIRFAESRQRNMNWAYGPLGDSLTENVNVRIRYCLDSDCLTMSFNGTSGNLTGLTANSQYSYTIQVEDKVNMKLGMMSDVMTFNTSVRDECMSGYWHCIGGWKCIPLKSLCDNKFDCPRDLPGSSVDETMKANCSVPMTVNVTSKITGVNFLRLIWKSPESDERVRGYVIVVDNTTYDVSANMTSHRIDGLKNGTSLEYTIYAVNPSGPGIEFKENVTLPGTSVPTSGVSSFQIMATPTKETSEWVMRWQLPAQLNNNDPHMLTYHITWCIIDTNSLMMECKTDNVTDMFSYKISLDYHSSNYTVNITVVNEIGQESQTETLLFVTPRCDTNQFECTVDDVCIARNKTCNGIFNDGCSDMADETMNASCDAPPPIQIEELNTGITFIIIKYIKPLVPVQMINFTISASNGTVLQMVILDGTNLTMSGDKITFTDGITGGIEFIIQAVASNLVGQSNATVLSISTPLTPEPPTAPRSMKFKETQFLESSRVSVTWESPLSTGGVIAKDLVYLVKHCQIPDTTDCENQNNSISVRGTQTVVGGLTANTNYTFSISAFSASKIGSPKLTATYTTLKQDVCRNSSYFRCPVKCLESKYLCNGQKDCADNLDETQTANCSAPGIVAVSSDSLWNAIKFSWSEPTGFPIEYHLNLSCLTNNTMSYTSMVILPQNVTENLFEGIPTVTNMTAKCSLSILAVNHVGKGLLSMNDAETVLLATSSAVTDGTTETIIGRESTQLQISWNAPSNTGNVLENDLQYVIEWCESADNTICKTMTVNTTMAIIDDLKSMTNYTITVTPINPLGQLGQLSTFMFLTAANDKMPSVPTNFRIVKHNEDPHEKIDAFWEPPVNRTGLAVSEIIYRVKYCIKPDKDCKTKDTPPGYTNITLEDLESRQLYELSVAALGRNGNPGPFASIVEHETDDSGLATWAIALIIIAVLIVLIVILALVAWGHFKSQYPSSYDPKSEQERARMNPGYQDDQV